MGSFGFAPTKTEVQPGGTRQALVWGQQARATPSPCPGAELASSTRMKCKALGLPPCPQPQIKLH